MGMLLLPWALGILVGESIGGAFLASSSEWMALQLSIATTFFVAAIRGTGVRSAKYGWRCRDGC